MVGPGTPRPSRAFTRAWLVGGGLATLLFTWLLAAGRWSLMTAETQANFYDVQARSLLHLHWDVPLEVLNIEAFVVHGKAFMYFGPFPALLRLPIVAATDRFDGRLTQLSMLIAFVVALAALRTLAWRARWLTVGDRPVGRGEAWATGALAGVLGGGSVLLFLANRPYVYDEAIVWGIALALAAYDQLIAYVLAPTRRRLVLVSLLVTGAFLTRGSIGLGPVVALILVALMGAGRALRARDRAGLPGVAALGAAALVPILFYSYVNYAKFGTLLSIPTDKQFQVTVDPNRREVLRANGGKLFRLAFVPTTLLQYARPDALEIHRLLPWISFPSHRARVIGDVRFDTLDRASSIPASMPAVALLAAVGIVTVVRPRRGRRLAVFRGPMLGAATGGFLMLTIAYVAHRYLGDAFPFLALGAVVGLPVLVMWMGDRSRRTRRAGAAVLGALVIASVCINVALGVWAQRAFSGNDRLVGPFVRLQREVDGRWFGGSTGGITRGELGSPASEGTIRVVGNCDGTYWSDGARWYAVERTNRTGYYRLRLRFSKRRAGTIEPLATSGRPNVRSILAVEYRGGDRVRFAYGSVRTNLKWYRGPTIHVDLDRTHLVELLLDPRTQQARIVIDGHSVLEPFFVVAREEPVTLGRAKPEDPVEARFSGSLTNLPVDNPFCRGLERRGQLPNAVGRAMPAVYPAVRP
jgi:hypothetical protein